MEFVYRRSYRGPLKAVIFDWAGTTVDYGSCAPAMVFVEVFAREGVEISIAEARGPMGMHKRDHIRRLAQHVDIAERWQTAHGNAVIEADIDRMYEAFIPLQIACLADYADLIPGTTEAIAYCRERGLGIGSNTGYNRAMLDVVRAEAAARGYVPDSAVSAEEVPAGRPEPWMSLLNAQQLRAFPLEACVKVDDTVPGIYEGLNAGMWTVGVTKSGNELGLSQADAEALAADDLAKRLAAGETHMAQAGAHYVIEGIWDLPGVIDDIIARLANGERP